MTTFKEGQRVVVSLRDEKEYSGGSGRLMHGRAGTVEKVKPDYVYGPTPKPGYLVSFDEPVAFPAYPNSAPVTAFWFGAHDLQAEKATTRPCRTCAKEAKPASGGCTNGKCAECHKRCVHAEGSS